MKWFILPLAIFMTTLFTGSAQQVLYGAIGGKVVLKPPIPPTSVITSILWKFNENLAVEWDGEIQEFSQFQGVSHLNLSNGELTVMNLTDQFNGEYVVEINNSILDGSINLFVISRVPKPSISVSCTEDKTKCTLTCQGNVEGMNPIPTYIWKFNNTEETYPHPNLDITPENTAPEFICELKNSVSQESSEPFANPFISNSVGGLKINTGLVVCVCLLAVVLGVAVLHKVKSGMWFFQKDSMPWEADFWQKTDCQAPPEAANGQPEERNAMIESTS